MDAGKVFVLLLSALVIGILAYLELKSRRARRESNSIEAAPEREASKQIARNG